MKKTCCSILSILLFCFCISAQGVSSGGQLVYNGDRNYIFTERTDLRRYDNGRYTGLVSREVSSFINPKRNSDGDYVYTGNFFVLQQTKRAMATVTSGVNDSIDSVFMISSEGEFSMLEDNGYPSFRSFPSYVNQEIQIGDTWNAYGERAVDPLEKGIFTKMPIYVQYTYVGDLVFHEEEVFELKAMWATRYGNTIGSSYFDYDGDADLLKATGNHTAKIFVSKATGNALLVSDSVNESFTYKDGKEVTFKGTISLFTEYPPSINQEKLQPVIVDLKDNSINVEKTDSGTRLSIHDLQFEPDSPVLLPGETERLDKIAKLLKMVPEKTKFLVEGHTARIGEEDGEYELSLERAHTIAKALIERGISADRIICKGYGGKLPIADNETPEGRALNRRVEITILE